MKNLAQQFDHHLTAWIQRLPGRVKKTMVAASFIGLPGVVIVVAVFFAVLAMGTGQTQIALATLAVLIAFGTLGLLKRVLRRVRPDTPYVQQYQLIDFSFPSGHSSGSFLVYGFLAHLASAHLLAPWSVIAAVLLWSTAFLVGVSRVYLGAHYPTDVVGAWTLSALWLIVITKLAGV